MRRSSNRVGVDHGDQNDGQALFEASAQVANKTMPESVDAARAQLQKELLRKKKAERRAHAKQRAKKKAPPQDQPAPELTAQSQATDMTEDSVARENNYSQQPSASSEQQPEIFRSAETTEQGPEALKAYQPTEHEHGQANDRCQSPIQASADTEEANFKTCTAPQAPENVPQGSTGGKNGSDSFKQARDRKINANAAASKIQKVLKKKLRKRYHSFLRSSSKVFAEECHAASSLNERAGSPSADKLGAADVYSNTETARCESSTTVTIESTTDLELPHELSNGARQENASPQVTETSGTLASLPLIEPDTHQVNGNEGIKRRKAQKQRDSSEGTESSIAASCSSSGSSSSRSRPSSGSSSDEESDGPREDKMSHERFGSINGTNARTKEPLSQSPVGPPFDLIRDAHSRHRATSMTLEHAAVRLQAWVRGNQGRQLAHEVEEELDEEMRQQALDEIRCEASVHIQALMRGYLVRHQQTQRRKRKPSGKRTEAADTIDQGDEESEYAAEWPAELNLEPEEGWDQLSTVSNSDGDFVAHTEFLSKGKIRVFCGTWNLHAKRPRDDLRLWIGLNKYHIVAVGSEECVNSIAKSVVFTSKKQWEELLKDTLGDEYVMVASHSLTAIHNVVFAHNSIVPLLRHVQSDAIATGIGNQLGNKGGVGVAFTVGKTSFAFVNCHFDAHQHNVEKRNANFHRINKELRLSPDAPSTTADAGEQPEKLQLNRDRTLEPSASSKRRSIDHSGRRISETFDRVFWFGDLNYRINGTRRMVDHLLLKNEFEVLHFNDQLLIEMKRGQVFRHFQEGPLHFRPTYKFDKNCNVYDSSAKQRIPSWTDRILYLSNQKAQDIEILRYASEPSFQTSDHRPVSAVFDVRFTAGRDAMQRGFSRVLAHGYKPTAPKSEACVVQ